MNETAVAELTVKEFNDEAREFSGVASSITPDRQLDVLVPRGAKYKLPIALFSKHDKNKPIGEVFWVKVTDKLIEYKARILKIAEDGALKQRVDEAWQEIKYGLVRGVSVGFLPVSGQAEVLPTGGILFKEWEWIELSPVAVPANVEATIATIKSLSGNSDGAAAPGNTSLARHKLGASGISVQQSKPKEPSMDIKKQIDALDAKRKELIDERAAIQTKAADEGRTKSVEERERFDTITDEVAGIDKELEDLRVMEKDQLSTAKPVTGQSAQKAAESRGAIVVKDNRVRGQGLALAQFAKCLFKAQGNLFGALQAAQSDQRLDPRVAPLMKAAVAAGSTSDATWVGALVGDEGTVYADFVEFLRPRTILGRFGSEGVPELRRVPFRVPLISQTTGGSGYWVGEGKAKPLTKFDFARTTLDPLKVANIAVLTEEAVRDSSPSADVLVRDGLVAALAERMDIDFVDPDKAAVAGASPGSITNGVAGISSSGSDADAIRADVRALWAPFITANNPPTTAVYIMSATTALALSLMTNALGQPEFPGLSMNGGKFLGVPVIVSEYMKNDGGSAGGIVVLANASDIYMADEGGFMVDLSREASLQMDSAPDEPSTAATVLVSLWQRNLVGFRAERTVNWARRRSSAVSWLDAVSWGQ